MQVGNAKEYWSIKTQPCLFQQTVKTAITHMVGNSWLLTALSKTLMLGGNLCHLPDLKSGRTAFQLCGLNADTKNTLGAVGEKQLNEGTLWV